MIAGVGIDMVSVDRVSALLESGGRAFLARVFHESEAEFCMSRSRPALHLAARMALKEAAIKALGAGRNDGAAWKDVEVIGGDDTAPRIVFHGRSRGMARERGVTGAFASITHEDSFAVGVVVLERG